MPGFVSSVEEAGQLSRPRDLDYLDLLDDSYSQIRKYSPPCWKRLPFHALPSLPASVEALELIREPLAKASAICCTRLALRPAALLARTQVPHCGFRRSLALRCAGLGSLTMWVIHTIVSSDTMKGGRVLPKEYWMPGHPRVGRSTT